MLRGLRLDVRRTTPRRLLASALVTGRFAAPSRARRPPVARAEEGMVLLETALAIPLLTAVAVALAWGISLTGTSMALGDAARQVARDVARGVSVPTAVAAAQGVAPGATVLVLGDGAEVVVVADQEVSAPGPVLGGLSVTLSQRVVIPREWT